MIVVLEVCYCFDVFTGSTESIEDLGNTCPLLHRDDSELVLFVDPDEESLGSVVEDTSALGPVAVKAASFEETVTLPTLKKRLN